MSHAAAEPQQPEAEAPVAPTGSSAPPASDWLHRYTAALQRGRNLVILAWIAIIVAGLAGTTFVFQNLQLQVDPIKGDSNWLARLALVTNFPARSRTVTTTIMLASADGVSLLAASPAARAASLRLAAFAAPYVQAGLLASDSGANYFQFVDLLMPLRAAPMLSLDGAAVLVQYFSTEGLVLSQRYKDFLVALREEMNAAVDASAGALTAGVTGQLPINADSAASITLDIGRSDSITVSISFLLLALALRSIRLIALTFAALVAAFGGAFLLTWPLTTAMSTPNFVTSLLISTLVSLSLDYSLFLLTHLKTSIVAGVPMLEAVEAMLRTSGHTVLVSGATLAACFLVLGIFPVSIVRAPGIATTFSVAMSVLANLTLTPALLLRFPGFFAGERCGCCAGARRTHAQAGAVKWEAPAGSETPDTADAGAEEKAAEAPPPLTLTERLAALLAPPQRLLTWLAPWKRVTLVTFRYRWSLSVALIALLIAPFAYRLPAFEESQSLRNIMPRGAESVATLYELQDRFGPGAVSAAQLIGVSASPVTGAALTPQFYASAAAAVNRLLAISAPAGVLQARDVFGLAFAYGAPQNLTVIGAQLAAVAFCPSASATACRAVCPPDACLLRVVQAASLSADRRAMTLSLSMRVPRVSADGIAWVIAAREALHAANDADPAGVTWHLIVDPSPDSIKYVYDRFGTLVGITAAVIFCILFVGFRSVAIAVRAVVTLTAMEVCIWGAGTATFVQGVLNPGGVLGSFSNDTGFFWLMPVLAFSLTTGLGLDYDIFLLSSICEERMAGWGDRDAVAVGLLRSGPVISWAGLIMAVAYSGFLFSEIPLLNQIGFFIVLAVLVDSFVVRPLLVPALMHILGPVNYWPRPVPKATKGPLPLLLPDAPPATEAKPATEEASEPEAAV